MNIIEAIEEKQSESKLLAFLMSNWRDNRIDQNYYRSLLNKYSEEMKNEHNRSIQKQI